MDEERIHVAPLPAEDEFEQDPNIVGELTDEEQIVLRKYRQQLQQHTMTIGQLEVQKARVFTVVAQLENQMEAHLRTVGQRLGLTGDHQWSVGMDGKIRVMVGEDLGPPKEA